MMNFLMADSLSSSSTNHFYSSCHYKYSLINLMTHWILVSVTKHGTSAHTNTVTWDMRDVIFRQTQQYRLQQLLCDSSSVYKYNVSSTILGEETPKKRWAPTTWKQSLTTSVQIQHVMVNDFNIFKWKRRLKKNESQKSWWDLFVR